MVFDHYIRRVSCYFFICVYLHIPNMVACLIFSDRRCFMFIPLVQHLDVVVLTCFAMYTCSYLVVSLNILKFRTARPIVSSYLLHILHIRLVPSFIIRAWYDLLVKLWSCASIIRPFISAFSPVLLSHFLVKICFLSSLWVFAMECFFLPFLW